MPRKKYWKKGEAARRRVAIQCVSNKPRSTSTSACITNDCVTRDCVTTDCLDDQVTPPPCQKAPTDLPAQAQTSQHIMPLAQYLSEKSLHNIQEDGMDIDNNYVIQGNFNQGHQQFQENSGRQCVANSLVSMLFNSIKPFKEWKKDDLDRILIFGNDLYSFIRETRRMSEAYLLISELPSSVNLFNANFSVKCGESYSGLLFGSLDKEFDCDILKSLKNSLHTALSQHNSCFVTFAASTFAVIRNNGEFCVFDPHSRSRTGLQIPNGKSLLIKYRSVEEVHTHCLRLARSMKTGTTTQFEVTGMDITDTPSQRLKNEKLTSNPTEHTHTSKEDIVVVSTNQTNYSFKPLSADICNNICKKLNLSHGEIIDQLQCVGALGRPCKMVPIAMDGNCFFRALSYTISGTEQNHRKIRLSVVKHLKENSEAFAPFLRPEFKTVEEYLTQSRMKYVHTWATEVEILAAADLLKIDIYIFSSSWLRYSRCQMSNDMQSSENGIYLKHCFESHYEVVKCVTQVPERGIYCSGNCLSTENELTLDIVSVPLSSEDYRFTELRQKRTKRRRDRDVDIDAKISKLHKLDDRKRAKQFAKYIKYSEDENYREVKKRRLSDRYRSNADYRQSKKAESIMKYTRDETHKKSLKAYSKKKYASNEIHRRNKIAYSKHKYALNEDHRQNVKAHSTKKYAQNLAHKQNVKAYSTRKYKQDPKHRSCVRLYSIKKYAHDEKHKQSVIAYNKKKYAKNPVYRRKLKTRSVAKYATDEGHRRGVKSYNIKKYKQDEEYRRVVKMKSCLKYKTSGTHRENLKLRNVSRRTKSLCERKVIENVIKLFTEMITNAPDHICSVCHRRLFPKEVKRCHPENYHKSSTVKHLAEKCISKKYQHCCTDKCDLPCHLSSTPASKLWICFTCHRKLLSGKMPAEAAANNLHLEAVPDRLQNLNSLEQHLIALHIPFSKLAVLPRGGQHGIHGPVVCVPSNVSKTVSSLPRCESEDQLHRVKLKRKLTYKGHYQYKFVNARRIQHALTHLKQHNKYYENVNFNTEWVNPFPIDVERKETDTCITDNLSEAQTDNAQSENPDEDNQQSHTEDHGLHMDSCLQPVDIGQEILDQHFDKILSLAPAEGNDPIKILINESNEAKSFPVLFPTGTPTYHDNREEKITIARYLHTRLMHADSRFARNTDYIFYAQYLSEVHQVLSSVSIALRKSFTSGLDRTIPSQKLLDNDSLREILRCDNGFKFLKPIRGTPAFWQTAQKDLFAMLRQLGIPTWFCSFSAGDMRWEEIVTALLKEEGDNRQSDDLDWSEKCGLLRRNPVTAARMFDYRFHCFLKQVILSPANPIGKVVDYFYRVEFQQRGSPHTHCLFWVENAPKFDKDTDEDVTSFIDEYVTCDVPVTLDEELHSIVTTVQQHSKRHSKSCRKKGTKCRFNFPRPPSKNTFVSRPATTSGGKNDGKDCAVDANTESDLLKKERAKQILKKIWEEIENTEKNFETVDELFTAVGIDQKTFQTSFNTLSAKASIVLRRNTGDVWINQYNADLLRCWNANMDIQYVLDAYSCIVYIISYISKAEREMGMLLEQASKETLEGNEDAKQAMKKLGGVYLHNRDLSAQEAVYRVCNLHLKECSRKVQFIPVGDNTVKMSLPLHILQSKCKGNELDTERLWMTSFVDRYKNRPDLTEFKDMCLASFCSEYRVLAKSEVSNAQNIKHRNPVHELQNGLGFVQKRSRTQPAIIRYPRFSQEKHPDKYYQSILQLFLPYRSEGHLKPPNFESYQHFYQTGAVNCSERVEYVKHIVDRNLARFETDADAIDRAEEIVGKCDTLEDAWAQICPETEAERLSSLDVRGQNEADPVDQNDIPDLNENEKRSHTITFRQNVVSHNEAQALLRSLNQKQQEVFYKVRQWCLDKVNGSDPAALHLYVSGGGGTGKSHLIKTIHYEATRILARILPNPDDLSVLLTAPTGVAAFNINASTIHSALSIGIDAKLPYQPLGDEKLNSLRSKLNSLQILIIDEISMVDHKLLAYVHGRLRQIKQCRDYTPFGNVSVIAVGDFYQLPPVKGKSLLSEPVGVDLWADNFRIVELTEIMRQKDGTFAATLNRLRTKKKSDNVCTEDLDTLTQRETGEESDAIHIFATNQQVDLYNVERVHSVCSDVVSIEAEDFFKDTKTETLKKRDKQFIKVFNTNLARRITLGTNARVLLAKNIDISDGLVNGVFGTVSHISVPQAGSFPSVIYVIFDNPKVGEKLRREKSVPSTLLLNSTPIRPEEDRVNNSGGLRRQFPLKLSFACTIHKLQGVTLDRAVVSLSKIFSPGQAYVALSRVTSLDGLIIQNFDESAIYCSEKVADSMAKMQPFLPAEKVATSADISNKHCNLVLHNIQGLKLHIEDIKCNQQFMNSDIICVTETWLNTADPSSEPRIDGFIFHHKSREQCYDSSSAVSDSLKQQSHGGVGIYHKIGLDFEHLNLPIPNVEHITCYCSEWNIIIAVIYRPASYTMSSFIRNFKVLLDKLENFPYGCIVMGDFNEDIFRHSVLKDLMEDRGFHQYVNESTTERGTLIDHVYAKDVDPLKVEVLPTYFSYHEAVKLRV